MSEVKRIVAGRAASILSRFVKVTSRSATYFIPVNVCPVVPLVLLRYQIPFQFLDIDPKKSFCINLANATNKLRSCRDKQCGLLLVRTYGSSEYLDLELAIRELKLAFEGLRVIDDRCLCMPVVERDAHLQTASDLILYSTGPKKPVNLNFGGFGFTRHDLGVFSNVPIANRYVSGMERHMLACADSASRFEYPSTKWNIESALPIPEDNYLHQVGIANAKSLQRKKRVNDYYKSEIRNELILREASSEWRFCIKAKNKKEVLNIIWGNGLFASSHFKPIGTAFGCKPSDHPNAWLLYESVINLFNDQYATDDYVIQIVSIVNKHAQPLA